LFVGVGVASLSGHFQEHIPPASRPEYFSFSFDAPASHLLKISDLLPSATSYAKSVNPISLAQRRESRKSNLRYRILSIFVVIFIIQIHIRIILLVRRVIYYFFVFLLLFLRWRNVRNIII